MKKGHLVKAGKTNPKRTQNEPKRTQFPKRQKAMQLLLPQMITKISRPFGSRLNESKTNPTCPCVAPAEAGFHRSVAPAEAGTKPISKRRKITCFGTSYPYNCWFGINIGDFVCVNNAAVVVLTQKPPSKTR